MPRDATIFDIGCGSGLFLSLLLARGQSIKGIGCEPNRQAIASAQKASKRLLDRVDREQNPMTVDFIESTTPQDWPQDTFSVVSLIDVMHHIPPQQQQAFFEAAVRRVRRGGILLYKDMCKRPFWKAGANRLHDLILARQWIHYVPLTTIKKWAKSYGLELTKEEHYSRFVYGHELLVFKNF